MSERFAPIAVFAYNRADLLAGMMESLRACPEFPDSRVTIFIDGPKGAADEAGVQAVRDYVAGLALPNVEARVGSVNKGLRRSVYDGVSELCDRHGRVIVLEDDLKLGRAALAWFNAGLDRYAEDPDVWAVCGYIYDVPELRGAEEALLLPWAHPWGWATWKRAWNRFDLDAQPTEEVLRSRAFRRAFDLGGVYPYAKLLRSSIEGRISSWFVHFYYTIFANGGRSAFPPRRLLDNFGISAAHGTHGGSLNPHELLVRRPPTLEKLPSFPATPRDGAAILPLLRRCREARVQRFISHAGALKRRLKSLIGA